MKRNILNITLSAVLIFVLIAGSLLIPRVLPQYKNQVTAHEAKDTARFKYINATDTLDIYPWDQYAPDSYTRRQNPMIEGTFLEAGELLLFHISDLFPQFLPQDEDIFAQSLYTESDGSGTLYIKDYSYNNIDGKSCLLNAAYEYGTLIYIRCRYSAQKELSKAQINQAGKALTENLRNINGWLYADGSVYMSPGDEFLPEGVINGDAAEISGLFMADYSLITPESKNPISSFFASFLPLLAAPPEYDYEIIWKEYEMLLTDYSVIYYDHYFIINVDTLNYSDDQSALYIFFDPIIGQIVGYSHHLL